ncbi:MBL fold metallo-hydrolase [Ferrovibrio sp.]|uniref:MBL fold metallo-hydrolase n=1 Tax=Ferrovibrio sp. TaxID=1917215 RepID=UPI003D124C05
MGRRVWLGLLLLLLGACAPSLEKYSVLPVAEPPQGEVGVAFLGVSTLLIDDGDTRIMVDGFFTRPGKLKTLFGRIKPDEHVIAPALDKYRARPLAAVVTLHSHHDHAMDAPLVAKLGGGATLIGSESTRMIRDGLGIDVPFEAAEPGKARAFGKFKLTLLKASHSKQSSWVSAPGHLTAPLKPPVRFNDYLEGGAYALLVEHGPRRLLVLGSAGLIKAEQSYKADVVFLAIGGLGREKGDVPRDLWNNAVVGSQAKRVIPTHWDDFTRPLSKPLQPFPWPFDDVPKALDDLCARAGGKIEVVLPPVGIRFDPFVRLPDPAAACEAGKP